MVFIQIHSENTGNDDDDDSLEHFKVVSQKYSAIIQRSSPGSPATQMNVPERTNICTHHEMYFR